MGIIPFYGADRPDLFALERAAMDRPGLVIEALDRLLPSGGAVIDVGAGDGFTAVRLRTADRRVVPVEPAAAMIPADRTLPWVRAVAAHLPFATGTVAGAYATWAYFFPGYHDPSPGLAELHRVVRPDGPLLIVDNLGGDEFTALADDDIVADTWYWTDRGFGCEVVDTCFAFETMDDARLLLGFYFGDRGRREARLELSYRVGIFTATSRGPAT